jgi:pimeloyl-ACP methyl ester carboxylesterase
VAQGRQSIPEFDHTEDGMTIETVPGTSTPYYLIAFDADGRERTDDPDGLMSMRALDAMRSENATDVFLLSHGWKGDIPAARTQYGAWMGAMLACKHDLAMAAARRPGFKPLLVGLHWPSLPFGVEDFGGAGVSFATGGGDTLERMVDRCAERIVDTPAARAALRTIFDSAQRDLAPAALPEPVRQAYKVLDEESALGSRGVGGSPGDDREPFDPDAAYSNAMNQSVSFGGTALSALLSPLAQLSFWKMKDRARTFGESGSFGLVSSLMRASDGRDVRFHLMGHSFGCIVASATVNGPQGARLPRPVNSLVLVQGALSLWSYCSSIPQAPAKPGYFRRIVSDRLVAGPMVTTRSEFDTAVGSLYPVAAGVAEQVTFAPGELPKYGGVGTFGARGPGLDIVDTNMLSATAAYDFRPGRIHNLEASGVIREGDPPSGAHSDIAKTEVAHVVWSAATTLN